MAYLSSNQSGFQKDRSTADVVWTHKWLSAKISITQDLIVKITGVDMSAAFDTINRGFLLEILQTILDEDELRIIRFLLSNTIINMTVYGATDKVSFNANTGTPQGDGLSPILFVIYLERALRDTRIEPEHEYLPNEVAYADDVDFISMEQHRDVDEIQAKLKPYQLNVNTDKTEYTDLVRKSDKKEEMIWRKTKKVGTLIGDEEDVTRRKSLSIVSMNKLTDVWIRRDRIKQSTRLLLYRSLVKSILLYNCGTWGLTKHQEESLDAHHRKQLRRLLGIRYPTKIRNTKLYEICNECPLSITILQSRWRLFGHILRRNRDIPAFKAMQFYFTKINPSDKNFRGRERTTLPTTLANDLDLLHKHSIMFSDHTYNCRTTPKLRDINDLENLRNLAQDRDSWYQLTSSILEARRAAAADVIAADAS